jgi:hypothetical protein
MKGSKLVAPASEPRSFRASEKRLFSAALKAVAILGYSIQHSDGAAGVMSFNTGFSMRSWAGQDMSVTVIAGVDGMNEVAVGGRRSQRSTFGEPQVYDWGERGKVTRQFFEAFERTLEGMPEEKMDTRPLPIQTSSPFEPDGIYAGIPYRVLETQAVDAMLSGSLVRFRDMDQFIVAATGGTIDR